MSLVENYQGESLLVDLLPRVYSLGYSLVGIDEACAEA